MKKVLILFLLCFTISNSFTQKPHIKFNKQSYDFGKFKEEDGIVRHRFEFTNTGSSPLLINDVKVTCGCTTPSWTKAPVMPNQKGFVDIEYDPANRPGIFNKTITINSNAENTVENITIKGEVIDKAKSLDELYRFEVGKTRFKSSRISFTKIASDKTKTESLPIINTSNEKVKVTFKNVPQHVSIKLKPETLAPQQKGEIIATFDPTKQKNWGYSNSSTDIYENNERTGKRLILSAEIFEDFSNLSAKELENAAKAEFNTMEFDFGTITEGEVVDYAFTIKNVGKSTLYIRKTSASCGCTTSAPKKMELQPNEETEITAKFDSSRRTGKQYKTITVITNDPKNPISRLKITGKVEKKQ